MGKILGIDLGTTNSCMAVMDNGQAIVLANEEGNKTTPSVVALTKDMVRLVGDRAKRQQVTNPKGTVSSIKRKMGTREKTNLNGKEYLPQEISAMILQKLRMDAEVMLGEKITEAVITVPAYFDDAQRQATKDAGRIAGLEVKRIINEPTAAALAYGLENNTGEKVMVFDLGGGTFDVSIIEIGDGVIEVLSTCGDNQLGGDDFNRVIAEEIFANFKREERIDLTKDSAAKSRVLEAAEKAKIELSSQERTEISLPFITMHKGEAVHLNQTLTRARFEQLVNPLVERLAHPVLDALKSAELTASQLNKVILVGGSTRMPCVVKKVKELTRIEPNRSMNPDECVAVGAAIQGAKLSGNQLVLSGFDVLLMDVTPLTLSIETVGGIATPLIERNTTIPCSKTQIFTTAANFQTRVEINVLQGERHFARDNKSLGKFALTGIKRAMRGVPHIEVTFDIDANGIVNVSAKDLGTGKHQEIVITNSSSLSEDEIQRAMNEAKMFEEQDKKEKEKITFKNECEMMVNDIQAKMHENKDMDKELKKELKNKISDLEKSIRKTKFEKITDEEFETLKFKRDELQRLSQRL
ncbi:MAG: molecular chaperone DnaK [Erysipelotrichaceae bacterium]|nr:molecular chaperone DnaK [Erysipelotrichaceae bacterium]